MEGKNVLFAIILSTIVLVFWATFFEAPVVDPQVTKEQSLKKDNSSSPSIDKKDTNIETTRSDAINETDRIKLENQNIKGSISLKGGIIDDIVFKNYRENLEEENKVIFLSPKNSPKEYFVETGWASGGNEKINLPLDSTVWKVKGNNTLTPTNPIVIEWENNEGLIFEKKIQLDEKFLFTITQSIKNNSNKSFQFYPYAQITRNNKPEGRQIYILHEGFIGVFGEELKEKDYGDIEDENFSINSKLFFFDIIIIFFR